MGRRALVLGALGAAACRRQLRNYNICVLLDISGSYAEEARRAVPSIGVIINSMQSNDRLTVGTIQTCSFSNDGVIVDRTFPSAPEEVFRSRVQVSSASSRSFAIRISQPITPIFAAACCSPRKP